MRTASRRRGERGTTLLEAMIALTVLLIGLVAMARLQVWGMASTQGARAQTKASQLATELAAGLTALGNASLADGRVSGNPSTAVDANGNGLPPAGFGALLANGTSGAHVFDDSNPIPGTHLDATLERDPEQLSQPVYHRRWTVWDTVVNGTGTVAAKIIAVSVIWRERTSPTPKEVVVYAAVGSLANVIGTPVVQ